MSKNFDKAIKQLSTELKNTEAARNFYKDILGQTGDEQLATTLTVSVYGDIGKDFKERIQSQLDEAFKSLSKADQTPEMKAAIDTQDFGYILSNLDKFSQEWQKVLQEAASSSIQYNAKWLKDLVSSYEKHKTFEERITETKQREAQQRVEIQKWEAEQIAAIDKDATKTTEEKTAAKAKVKATSTQMHQQGGEGGVQYRDGGVEGYLRVDQGVRGYGQRINDYVEKPYRFINLVYRQVERFW